MTSSVPSGSGLEEAMTGEDAFQPDKDGNLERRGEIQGNQSIKQGLEKETRESSKRKDRPQWGMMQREYKDTGSRESMKNGRTGKIVVE